MPRVALRVAYDGTRFHGSQRQPEARTVDGELLRGLARIGAIEGAAGAGFQSASRTDRGVSAVGNVVALDTGFRRDALLPALGASVEDVWPHGLAEVPDGFDARRARSRTYVYFLPAGGVEAKALESALQAFVGTHDFRNFARLEPGVDPVRRVEAIAVAPAGAGAPAQGFHAITVRGESFLWNQVRRMVEAGRRVAAGEAPAAAIARGLSGERVDLGTAPAEGLVLLDVDHGLAWQGHAAAREAALAQLGARLAGLALQAQVLDAVRRGLGA